MSTKKARPVPRLHDVEAVIFDLDGVLVDSEPIHFRAAKRVLQRYGSSLSDAENRTSIGLGETASWAAWRARAQIPDSVDTLVAAHTQARLEEIAEGVDRIDAGVELAQQ